VIAAVLVAAPVLIVTLLGVAYRPDVAIPAGRTGQHLDVAGTKIRYVQKGAGPDVLLVHGCPGSIEDWDSVIGALAQDFRVTAFDRPGHAYSGADGDLYTYDYHANVVLALIEALELHDVTLVGHSYGGATALAAALRKPSAVKSIVILDSAVYELTEKPSFIYHSLALPGFGTGFARIANSTIAPPRIAAGLRAQFPNGEPPDGFVDTRQQIWNQPKVTVAVAKELLRSDRELLTMSPRYSSIEIPTFIAAQADHPLRRQTGERLAREIAGAQLILLSGTGHYVHVEKPEKIIALIRQAVEAAGGKS
jgi:pimeloyl-ACP methyl ester carboxylesterase